MTTMRPTDRADDGTIPDRTRPYRIEQAGWRGELPRTRHRHRRRQGHPSGKLALALRGIVGALVGGWLVLALLLVGVQVWAVSVGQAGPGIVAVLAHLLPAALAIRLQMVADRRDDVMGGVALFGAFGLVMGTVWFWWWV